MGDRAARRIGLILADYTEDLFSAVGAAERYLLAKMY